MIEIRVEVCGDYWTNPGAVEQALQQISGEQSVIVDLGAEGPSLQALGIDLMIDQYIAPDRVWLRGWANNVEPTKYQRTDAHGISHFFWRAQSYWHTPMQANSHEFRFGAFVGRLTWPRLRMLWDLRSHVKNHCLLSLMDKLGPPPDSLHNKESQAEWNDSRLERNIVDYIHSLDRHHVQDQYDPKYNTNQSLIGYYHKFDIEIASETYCRGQAFFPTEKTIRPMLYHKPMLIYGPRHFLHNLRSLGFQTWSDHWDESYDDFEGIQRWQAMFQQIQILSQSDHFDQILQDCKPIVDHNAQHARDISRTYRPV